MNTLAIFLPTNAIFFALAFIAIVLLLYSLFLLEKTHYILYGLLVWFPFETFIMLNTPPEYLGGIRYVPEVLLYGLLAGAWIRYVRRSGKWLPKQPLNQWFFLFLLVAAVSLVLNWYSAFTWALGLRQLLRFASVVFIVLFLQYDREQIKRLAYVALGVFGIQILIGLLQFAARGALDRFLFFSESIAVGSVAQLGGIEQFWTPGSRIFATMGRYDRLGSFLALILTFLFPWLYALRDQRHKLWYSVGMLGGALALVLTFSRASWLGAIAGIAVIGIYLMRDKRVVMVGSILGVLLVGYLASFAVASENISSIVEKPTQSLQERVFEAFSLRAWQESYDGAGRIFFIINTPRIVVKHAPLFGVGPGNYGGGVAAALSNTRVYEELSLPFGVQNVYGQIDNSWMSIWGEYGTVGLLIWIGVFATVIRVAYRLMRESKDQFVVSFAQGSIGATIAVMVFGFFGPYFEFRSLMFYYWLGAGVLMYLWYQRTHAGNFLHKY